MNERPLTRPADILPPPGGERAGARGKIDANAIFALLFGLFLGLAIWKFGNPVILDHVISPPTSLAEWQADAWPTHWSNWILLPLVLVGAILVLSKPRNYRGALQAPTNIDDLRKARRSQTAATKWLWLLPLLWFGWQLLSAMHTVDTFLTTTTLWQLGGCVACYFIGALVIGAPNSGSAHQRPNSSASTRTLKHEPQPDFGAGQVTGVPRAVNFLLVGVLAAFTFCLVRAADQRLFEFSESRKLLLEGERTGWTNFPPDLIWEMKRDGTIINTNGVDVVNPAMLARVTKGRVMGTLVYPNALAGVILLLFPVSLALAFNSTRQLKLPIRGAAIVVTCLLGGLGLFWSGSKAGWLLALALVGIWLFRLKWSARLKWAAVTTVVVVGLAVFALRFHNYFTAGATSVGARFDYWRAALQTTRDNPVFGTGPGTFQRPYEQIKSPEAEMARMAHNDYLEQFSDSGIVGGVCYAAWIGLALVTVARRVWRSGGYLQFGLFLGLLGWFVQGLVEFSLYVPALAWTAFTLLGCLARLPSNPFDNRQATS